ncbi:hypothetical protein [Amycolatopsis sp. RTGN1]|uniref:hypothetical protein n=1 Tax=Amycolatopsis ponsaeliensis TaxID=2992142 RepID=UPI00254F0FD2|nr:hypothetical protein [Amycolatopsis sp. RTGN1]
MPECSTSLRPPTTPSELVDNILRCPERFRRAMIVLLTVAGLLALAFYTLAHWDQFKPLIEFLITR